jgi:hypothetical protein
MVPPLTTNVPIPIPLDVIEPTEPELATPTKYVPVVKVVVPV